MIRVTIAVLLSMCSSQALAQQDSLEDWPCVQRFVPEILPASYWPVPIGKEESGQWRSDPDTASLARQLADLDQLDESAIAALNRFAAAHPDDEREAALTRLADGVVDLVDERRAHYLKGIRKYTRQQIAIAGQIEATLNQLADLDDQTDETTDADVNRADIEETLAWHERLYDQRERAIRSLCERPVELEQSVSRILRELSYRLPGG